MNAALTKRLLWKEYRTHRGLWAALVGVTVLLQLVSLTIVDTTESFGSIALGVAMILTVTYAAGSGAMSFAMDREEGTQVRLQAMSCPPALSMTLKLLFVLSTTVAMILAFVGSARIIGGEELFEAFPKELTRHQIGAISYLVLIYAAVLLFSMFFSLLTRKVMPAVALGAAGGLCFVVTSVVVVDEFRRTQRLYGESTADLGRMLSIEVAPLALLLICNYLLAGRWCRRFASDGESGDRFSISRWVRSIRGRGKSVPLEVDEPEADPAHVYSPQEGLALPAPRSMLSWLQLAAASPSRREFRFLRWREATESRRQFFWLLAGCVFVTFLFAGHITPHRREAGLGMVLSALYSFPAICGLMSFRQEQAKHQFRILRDRGVPASSVWLTKQFVWGLRTVAGIGLLVGLATLLSHGISAKTPWLLSALYAFRPRADVTELAASVAIGRAAIVASVFYVIGTAASLFFRSAVVSFALGILLCILASMVAVLSESYDVSIARTLLPLVPGLLLTTYVRCRSWMLERDGIRGEWPSALIISATILICAVSLPLRDIAESMAIR